MRLATCWLRSTVIGSACQGEEWGVPGQAYGAERGGDYVYVQRSNTSSTLQFPTHSDVLRITSMGPLGVAVLRGRCGREVRRRVEQLRPCHLPDIDEREDPRLQVPSVDLPCEVCQSAGDADRMLLCDGCGTGWHTMCLKPPLPGVPEGQWICPRCVEFGRELPPEEVQPIQVPQRVLFPGKAARDERAKALVGRRVKREYRVGRRKHVAEGVLKWRGEQHRPYYFLVEWDGDGAGAEMLTYEAVRRMLV